MDPQNRESGMELPPPVEVPNPDMPREKLPQQIEQAGSPAGQERAPAQGSPAGAMPPAMIPLPTPPALAGQRQGGATPAPATAGLQASDDSDLIEKEWVNKAKQIVERTRDDPYRQSEELTVVKADYLKKRYNKTIKIK